MFTTIITDCSGENEKGRQLSRYNSLGLGPANLIAVSSNFSEDATIEGGADLIDILDATAGEKGVIVLNVAPRGNKNEGSNGNSFSYFYFKKTLIVSSTKGHCLTFVKRFGLTAQVNVVEVSEVLNVLLDKKIIDKNKKDYITKTQFRSFDFVPRLAHLLVNGESVPSTILDLPVRQLDNRVWHIDAFGNCKLTLTSKEIFLKETPGKIKTSLGLFSYYERLKDVPFGETAIYTGSSGIFDDRFLELSTQGISGSAAGKFKLKVGDKIEIL